MARGITIVGCEAISRRLRLLAEKDGKKVVRSALRKALRPVKSRVQALAPVASGQTRRAVKVLSGRSKKGRITVRVVIGKGAYEGDQFYAAFQEYGWKQGSRGLGEGRRQVEGKHFMKRAFEETSESAKADAERLILEGIEAKLKG